MLHLKYLAGRKLGVDAFSKTVTNIIFNYLSWDFFFLSSKNRLSGCFMTTGPTVMCSTVVFQVLGFLTFVGFPIPPFLLGVISQDNQKTCLKHRLFHQGCKSENQISKPVRSVCKIRIPIFWVKAWGNPFWLSDTILTTHRSFLLSFVIFVRQVELLGIWILARRDVTIFFWIALLISRWDEGV